MTRPAASTYTTIPISAGDVISRSLQNLSSAVSNHRPWPELIASGTFTRPDSFSSALNRIRTNFYYFRINYSIIVSACGALSLIGSLFTLIVFSLIFALWLLLYLFREDPLVVWGYDVNDRLVLAGLLVVSFLAGWWTGGLGSLVVGVVIGVLICGVHAVLRNEAGDVFDGASPSPSSSSTSTLIGPISGPSYGSVS